MSKKSVSQSSTPSLEPWGLHWFRRDLRVPGNPALIDQFKAFDGRVMGIFCFDSTFLKRSDFSHHRFGFFLNTLTALQRELQNQGSDLLIVDAPPRDAFDQLFTFLKRHKSLPQKVTWNRDYEPFARTRDMQAETAIQEYGVATKTFRDHLVLEPNDIERPQSKSGDKPNSFYQVYTPFSKRWIETIQSPAFLNRITGAKKLSQYVDELHRKKKIFSLTWSSFQDLKNFPFQNSERTLENFINENNKQLTITLPKAGIAAAHNQLSLFAPKLLSYKQERDLPSQSGTSHLSIYLKNGTITTNQIIDHLKLLNNEQLKNENALQYLKELIWREFYYAIIYHRPDCEHEPFLKQYRPLQWQNNEVWFSRWKEGTTGFPIVDAGMRQLCTTGWMHNRVRMIVASFLTKDLLIDYRWGERYFMEQLLDGDLAPNNGGWQWAASTGCDPQPYFRIFNPWSQAEKFDPDCIYIKKYIPELKTYSTKMIHSEDAAHAGLLSNHGYPRPIVQHSAQRLKALEMYKACR